MIKSLFKDSLTYSVSGFLNRGIAFIMLPFYTRVFSPRDYGILDIITVTIFFITNVVSLQINQAVGRYYVDTDSPSQKITIVSTGFVHYVISFGFTASIIILLSKSISSALFQTDSLSGIISIAALFVIFLSLYYYTSILFRYRFESKRFSLISILNVILNASLIIFFVLFLKFGLLGVFWGKLVSCFIVFILSFLLLKDNFDIKKISFSVWKKMVKYGTPLIPAVMLLLVVQYCDRFMIIHFLGLGDLGIYAIGIRLATIITLLFIGFKFAWGPYVFDNYKDPKTKEVMSILFKYLFLLSILLVLLITLFSPELLFILTTKSYYGAYRVVPLLAGSTVLYTLGAYFSFGFGIAEKNIFSFYVNLIAAAVNVVLNILFIPRFGIQGAALATFLSMLVFFVSSLYLSNRLYKVDFHISKLFIPILAVLAGVIFGLKFFGSDLGLGPIVFKIIIVAIFVAILFLIKAVDIKEIKRSIFKEKQLDPEVN